MKKCTAPRAHAYKKRRMELSRNKEKRSKQRYQEAYQEPSNLKMLIACGLVQIVPQIFIFQHSSSIHSESKCVCEMLDFCRQKGFCKCICYHFFSRAVDKSYFAVFNNPSYEVEMNVDVLGSCMLLMFLQ